jgi:electron transport complex protein RnfG
MSASAANKTTAVMPPATAPVSGFRMIATMGAIGVACGILIVLTFQLTLPRITSNKIAALEKAIFEVVPGAEKKVTFKLDGDKLIPSEGDDAAAVKYYACYSEDGRLVGVAIEASGQGFADIIKLLYGYSPGKEAVVGIKVLESKETPGLGDKIEKDPDFIANFDSLDCRLNTNGSDMINPIILVKPGQKTDMWQIEAITGATISSRAVTGILATSTAVAVPLITENLQALERGAN